MYQITDQLKCTSQLLCEKYAVGFEVSGVAQHLMAQ